jgi:ribosome recycling factor
MTEFKKNLNQKIVNSFNSYKHNLASIRTGRASISLLDQVKVDVYGSLLPINQLANISVQDSNMLIVQLWDKNNVASTEKAIRVSELGLNPSSEGEVIRVPIPKLSEERRLELAKICANYSEQARISIRNIRRDVLDKLKKEQKDSLISEDELKSNSSEVQKIIDDAIKEVDQLFLRKKEEVLSV